MEATICSIISILIMTILVK